MESKNASPVGCPNAEGYQNAAPTGLWYLVLIWLPKCRPYRAVVFGFNLATKMPPLQGCGIWF